MRIWLWIAPMLVLAACSRNQSQNPQAATSTAVQAGAATPLPNSQPTTATPSPNSQPDPPPVTGAPASDGVEIPGGTLLRVRVDQALSTRRNSRGDRFTATLTDPVVVNGEAVLPSGTRLAGHVLVSRPSPRLKAARGWSWRSIPSSATAIGIPSQPPQPRASVARTRSGIWRRSAVAPAPARRSAPSREAAWERPSALVRARRRARLAPRSPAKSRSSFLPRR